MPCGIHEDTGGFQRRDKGRGGRQGHDYGKGTGISTDPLRRCQGSGKDGKRRGRVGQRLAQNDGKHEECCQEAHRTGVSHEVHNQGCKKLVGSSRDHCLAERSHCSDNDQQPPVYQGINFVFRNAPHEDREHGRAQEGNPQRQNLQPAQHDSPQEKPDDVYRLSPFQEKVRQVAQHQGGSRRAQVVETPLRTLHQEHISYFQRNLPHFLNYIPAIPRESERRHSVPAPEIDLLQGAPHEARPGPDHHFGQLDAVRFQAVVSQIHVALDLHSGRLAESVNSFYCAFEEERIILLQDFTAFGGE